MCCFSFSFISWYFKFSFETPFWIYRFRSMLFNFHMSAGFSVVFLLLISYLILLWLENSLCLILTFKILLRFVSWVKTCSMDVAHSMVAQNKNSAAVGWSGILASMIISLQKCGWIAFKWLGFGLVPTLWCQLACFNISKNSLLTGQDLTLELFDAWLGIWSVIHPHFPHLPIFYPTCVSAVIVSHVLDWFSFKPCPSQVHLYLFSRSWPIVVSFIQRWSRARRSSSSIWTKRAIVPMTLDATLTQWVIILPTDLACHSDPSGNSHSNLATKFYQVPTLNCLTIFWLIFLKTPWGIY